MKILQSTLKLTALFILALGATDIIVTNHPRCTEMAKNYILNHNVTPPELAIIISVCEGIVNPQDAGLGGGFQAVIYNGNCNERIYVNSRERAPESYEPSDKRKYRFIGVPSMLKGYEYLYNLRMCNEKPSLPWKDLFTQNIELALTGWNKTKTTDSAMYRLARINHTLVIDNSTHIWKNPKLARTLKIIAKDGPQSSLYRADGELHTKMMDDLNAANSFIQSSDLLNYRVKTSIPFYKKCMGYTVATSRIPGSGSTFILGCKIVEAALPQLRNLSESKRFLFMYHTTRYMYSLKPYLRSTKFNLTRALDNADEIALDILSNLDKKWTLTPIRQFGNYKMSIDTPRHRRQTGTTNIIIKRGKYAVSMTSTINWTWGSCLFSNRLGLFYNNQLRDFDLPGTPNEPKGNKQPQSAISTVVMYSKKHNPVFQIGSSGGTKIIGSIFNTFFNYFVNNMTLVEANRAPRCFPKYKDLTEQIYCENEISSDVQKEFEDLGFSISLGEEGGFAAVTTCSTMKKKPEAAYDYRRGGDTYIQTT